MRLSLSALLDRWLAPAPEAARVAWLRGATFAHRGLHGAGRPENSLAACAAALERGFGIECDVHLSRDGWPIVFHDWELDRLTAETGSTGVRSAAELGRIALSGSAEGIPTLRRVLDLVDGREPILIEVKSRRGRRVAPLCRAVRRELDGYHGPHAVMSFDPRVARWFSIHAPGTVRGLVVSEENERGLRGRMRRHLALWYARPDFLAYDIRDLPARFPAAQRRRGLPVATWTVRSTEQRARAQKHADAPIVEGPGVP